MITKLSRNMELCSDARYFLREDQFYWCPGICHEVFSGKVDHEVKLDE